MTYGDMYNEIVLRAYSTTVPPENTAGYIRRKMKACQRMINRDYNFWFSLEQAVTITTVVNQRDYALPTNFKELERCNFVINLQSYNGPKLRLMNLMDDIDDGYDQSSVAVEYPTDMKVDGTTISLYPLPSEVRTLNIKYWKFLPLVDDTDEALFNADEDAISIYCCEALISYVLAGIKVDQNEWEASQILKQEYLEAIEGAKFEDTVRRQIPENEAP